MMVTRRVVAQEISPQVAAGFLEAARHPAGQAQVETVRQVVLMTMETAPVPGCHHGVGGGKEGVPGRGLQTAQACARRRCVATCP